MLFCSTICLYTARITRMIYNLYFTAIGVGHQCFIAETESRLSSKNFHFHSVKPCNNLKLGFILETHTSILFLEKGYYLKEWMVSIKMP